MLHFKNLSKSYLLGTQRITALHDISLEINEGEFIVVMGPSGSGKSTLLHILGGLDRPTQGDVLFYNKNLSDMDDQQLSSFRNEHVGFVFQDALLLPHLTLLENVMLPLLFARHHTILSKKEIEHLLNEVGLSKRLHHKPSELSGGQKQRACIARALVTAPSLILADEPTGNLDSKTGREIIDLFKKLHTQKKSTFVIATHDAEIAKTADRFFHIVDGAIKPKHAVEAPMLQ